MPSPPRFSKAANLVLALGGGLALSGACFAPALAQAGAPAEAAWDAQAQAGGPTYVDLIEMASAADIVARVEIDDQTTVPPERAPGVAPGEVRLYVEAVTQALLGGRSVIGESLRFLVDMPRDEKGKAPKIKKQVYLVFAHTVDGRPGEIQLVGPQAIQPDNPALEERVRVVLNQLAAPERPPVVTGIREAMSVPGNLAGESETQVFASTADGAPVSLTVLRRPGQKPAWGVSWSDIVDQSAKPPEPETLAWYSLACFLPPEIPDDALLQRDRPAQMRAREDYAFILDQLGTCARSG